MYKGVSLAHPVREQLGLDQLDLLLGAGWQLPCDVMFGASWWAGVSFLPLPLRDPNTPQPQALAYSCSQGCSDM